MITILAYIINMLAPLINFLGALGICFSIINEDLQMLLWGGILFVVGFVFGLLAYGNDIPPRWFWSKSTNEIFSFSVTAIFGYAVNFAMWPLAIYFIIYFIELL